MMTVRKILSLVISLLFLMTIVLSGCGGTGEQNTAKQETAPDQSAYTGDEPQETALKPVKLSWYMLFSPQADQNSVFEEVNRYVKDKINAEIDFRPLDWGAYVQKLQTAAAAGEEFDITWISDWMDVRYANFAQRGAIIPLDDLITQYAPQTKQFLAQKYWDMMKVNGKIYGVPCYQIFCRTFGMWLRQDLVEKYAFDYNNVKSLNDFETFFDAILNGEKEKGVIPIAANGIYLQNIGYNTSLAINGGVPENKDLGMGMKVWKTNMTKAFWEYDDPQLSAYYLANMKLARKWYLKGYVRKDYFSVGNIDSEIKAKKYAVGFCSVKPGVESELKEKFGFDVVSIPTSQPVLDGVTATELSISATSKNPERAMMFIELLNTDKYLFNLLANGIENKHYKKVNENRIERIENSGYMPGIDWALGNTTLGYITPGKRDDVFEQTNKMNEEGKPPLMPDWNFNSEKIKSEEAVSGSIWRETGLMLWGGVVDPDEYFPQYIKKMKDAGVYKMLEEVQKQLDEYWKTHKQ